MAQKVIIQNPTNGLTKNGYFGFSWTYLLFGWLVPIFRGELGVAALHAFFTVITLGIWQIVMAFLYNKQYMTRMLEKGYVLKDTPEVMNAARASIGLANINQNNESSMPEYINSSLSGEVNKSSNIIKKVAPWIGGISVLIIAVGYFNKEHNLESTSAPAQAEKSIYVGDTFSTEDFEVSVKNTDVITVVGDSIINTQPAEGAVYVAVQISYKNISSKPINVFDTPSITLMTPDGVKYEPDLGASTAYGVQLNLSAKVLSDLNPGIKVNDAIVFEVSKELFDPKTWKIHVKADNDVDVKFVVKSESTARAINDQGQKIATKSEVVEKTVVEEAGTEPKAVEIPNNYLGQWGDANYCKSIKDGTRVGSENGADLTKTNILFYESACDLILVKLQEKNSFIGGFSCNYGEGEQPEPKDIKLELIDNRLVLDSSIYNHC